MLALFGVGQAKFFVLKVAMPSGKKPQAITELVGIALGVLGMSLEDFDRLTPAEFNAVYDKWSKGEESRRKEEWERARLVATILVSPHVKNKVTPQRLMPLPWDGHKAERGRKSAEPEEPRDKQRVNRLISRFGKD